MKLLATLWSGDTHKNIFWIMASTKEIRRYFILTTRNVCQYNFSATFFNRHKMQYGSGAFFERKYSNLCYFLPSLTDRVEKINRHMGSMNLTPIDISENTFEVEDKVQFDPSKLDYECKEKEKITQAVVKMLKKFIDISNSNLIKNVNSLLSTQNVDEEVEWIGKGKKRLAENRYKMSY